MKYVLRIYQQTCFYLDAAAHPAALLRGALPLFHWVDWPLAYRVNEMIGDGRIRLLSLKRHFLCVVS